MVFVPLNLSSYCYFWTCFIPCFGDFLVGSERVSTCQSGSEKNHVLVSMWLWTTFQKCFVTAISLLFKFCVRCIFATFLSLKESTCKTRKIFFIWLQNLFPFSRKSKFRTLDIQILWCHQMPNHKKRDTFNWISLELNTAC